MAEIKDMYRVTKIFREIKPSQLSGHKASNKTEAVGFAFNVFKERRLASNKGVPRWLAKDPEEAAIAINMAEQAGYIEAHTNKEGRVTFFVTKNGYHLTAKKWKIYPSGLIDESLSAYGETKSVILSSVVAAVLAAIVTYFLSK